MRGYGVELQGQGVHHTLLQAKSCCCSLRVYTACIQAGSEHAGWVLHGLGSEQREEHGSPRPSWEQLKLEEVHAGSTGRGEGVAAFALHGSSASSPPVLGGQCQGSGWPRCRHRVNPEWLVCCLQRFGLAQGSFGARSPGKSAGGVSNPSQHCPAVWGWPQAVAQQLCCWRARWGHKRY